MTTITRAQTVTDGQKKQFSRFLEDAFAKLKTELETQVGRIGSQGAQRVIEHGDEFALKIREAALASLQDLSVSDKFKDEETESSYGYLSGYKAPKGITEQCNRLHEIFPGIGYCSEELQKRIEKNEIPLPQHAEGWFAVPNWTKNPKIFGATYSEAVLAVLKAINTARNGKFYNYREGQITEGQLRQSARTQKFFAELSKAQGDPDILLVPAQFGIRHRGRSVRRAREVFFESEYGLGSFAVGIMVLLNPKRLMNYDDLWIDCAGDEFDDPDADVRFDLAPCFSFDDGKVEFGTDWFGNVHGYYGSASAFLPQQ